MTKLHVTLMLAICACSAPIALEAQRGGNGGSHMAFGGRFNAPPQPTPSSAGLSISRPIGADITSVRTNPPLGMDGRPVPSPFAAGPRAYSPPPRGPRSFGIPLSYAYGSGVAGYADAATVDAQQVSREEVPSVGVLYV